MDFPDPVPPGEIPARSSPYWPTAASSVVATIGFPISHSMSPLLHQAAFDALGLDWVSVAFAVPEGSAGAALSAMRTLGIRGLSVTMPHKTQVANECDELSPLARRLAAVNCVINRAGTLYGDSTDGQGLLAALDRASGVDPAGKICVVIGAGGAARAAIAALADSGAREVVVVNRTVARAIDAAELAGGAGRVGEPADIARADIVVNATPVGMGATAVGMSATAGDTRAREAASADPQLAGNLHAGQVVMDLVYVPSETPLLRAAAQKGAVTIGGIGMLVHQAAIAIGHWTGEKAPTEHMWKVAQNEISARERA